ncbi:MAG: 5-formyltetrahydrofolate cyclo-ligase [Pseudomonadota bacterium]
MSATDPLSPKAAARKAAFARRKEAHATFEGAALAATEHLLKKLKGHKPTVISAYLPIRTELDPQPAIAALAARGHQMCLPVVQGPGLPLSFRAYAPGDALIEGAFKALIPQSGAWLEPQVLIVPLVAFNRSGYRLGYGGGFYDRTLEGLRARGPVQAFGFAYAAQEAETLPLEPTDQPLDAIITERGVVRPLAQE